MPAYSAVGLVIDLIMEPLPDLLEQVEEGHLRLSPRKEEKFEPLRISF